MIDGLAGEQRFFISFAPVWRTKMTPEQMRVAGLSKEHAPGSCRVNGTLANMPGS